MISGSQKRLNIQSFQSLHGAKLGTQEVTLPFEHRTTYTYINLLIRGLYSFTSCYNCFLKLSNIKWKMDVIVKDVTETILYN